MDERAFIASRIKKARNDTGLNQVQFAAKIDRPNSTLANWELGRSEPDASALKRIADFTRKPLLWFLTDEENSNQQLMPVPEQLVPVVHLLIQQLQQQQSAPPPDPQKELVASVRSGATGAIFRRSRRFRRAIAAVTMEDLDTQKI